MYDKSYIVVSRDENNYYTEQWHDEEWANERAAILNEEEDNEEGENDYYVIEWKKPESTD